MQKLKFLNRANEIIYALITGNLNIRVTFYFLIVLMK